MKFRNFLMRQAAPLSLILIILLLPKASLAEDQAIYKVGTWKTAQTIQPFLYERFLPGRQVKIFPFTNPGDQKAALLAGSLDMAGTTLPLAIEAASRGEPVVLVAALCNKCSALVVAKDSGIKSVVELKGKKIGYVPGTMHEVLLRESLAQSGLNPASDVKLIRVDFFDMGAALAKGDIDAFLSGEPLPTQAELDAYGRVLAYPYFDETIGPINAGLLVRRDVLEKNPEKIGELIAAHVQATKALEADQSLWLNEASELFGIELRILEAAAPNMELAWDMDDTFMRQLKTLGSRLKDLGSIDQEPDYEALVYRGLLEQAKEFEW